MYELIPSSGIDSLGRLRRDFDGLFGRLFDENRFPVEGAKDFVPSVDFKETEEAFELTAEVPGLKPEQIDITLTGDLLTLRGEKKEETEKTGGGLPPGGEKFRLVHAQLPAAGRGGPGQPEGNPQRRCIACGAAQG